MQVWPGQVGHRERVEQSGRADLSDHVLQLGPFHVPIRPSSSDSLHAANDLRREQRPIIFRKGFFELTNGHVPVADRAQEKKSALSHRAMPKDHVKGKKTEARVRGESGVPIAHEVFDPFMEREMLSAGK